MQDVIDLCSDGEAASNSRNVPARAKNEAVLSGQAAEVKTEAKVENAVQEPQLASGVITPQRIPRGKSHKNRGKKRKRQQRDTKNTDADQLRFADDEELTALRAEITEADDELRRLNEAIGRTNARLKTLKNKTAGRLKFLRRQADEQFDWVANFPWADRLRYQLSHIFKISSFRPFQHEALNATLLKRDVFSILPTGAGKSLIYQLAAVVDGGLTLVVTPLLSLSMDQRMSLNRLDIRAASIDSVTDSSKIKKIYNEFLPTNGIVPGSRHPRKRKMRDQPWIPDDMKPAILFVTPEQIAKSKRLMQRLEGMHQNGHLSRICIDEAHCASLWGHDFRPEYRRLGRLRRQLPDTPILSLTATCSEETVEDVCSTLETRDCVIFRGSIDRPNLYYEVREKGIDDAAVLEDIVGWITGEFRDMCGIIYVLAKKDAFNYAKTLREAGIKAGCYHGDLEREQRNEIHQSWSDGSIQVVVATIAFGLGIDNQRVRFIIHATMATSLEAYYQESGRAGRDGKPAKCIVLHRAKEFPRMSAFVADKGGDRLKKMYEMYQYASSRGVEKLCRRATIARAFGEVPPDREEKKSCCDVCAARVKGTYHRVVVDVSNLAATVARIVLKGATERPDEKVTLLAVASDWGNTGPKGKRIRGEEKAVPRGVCVDTRLEILVELILKGILKEYHRHSSYSINAYVTYGEDVGEIFDGVSVRIVVTKEEAAKLVMAGCQIVGGIGDWKNDGNEVFIEEELMDGDENLDEELTGSGHAKDKVVISGDAKEEDISADAKEENILPINGIVGENADHGTVCKEEGVTADGENMKDKPQIVGDEIALQSGYQEKEDDDSQSDEEVVQRKRIRLWPPRSSQMYKTVQK